MYSCPFFAWHFFFSSWPRKPMMSFRKTEKKGKERGKGNTCIHADSLGTKNLIAIHKTIQFSHITIYFLISINQIQLQVQWLWSMLHQNVRCGPCVQCTKSKFNTILITDHINNKQEQAHTCAWHQHGNRAKSL